MVSAVASYECPVDTQPLEVIREVSPLETTELTPTCSDLAGTIFMRAATATTTAPPTGDCHPAYEPCLPNLAGDALNCGDLTSAQRPVRVKQIGVDPYRLDRDQDGNGCE